MVRRKRGGREPLIHAEQLPSRSLPIRQIILMSAAACFVRQGVAETKVDDILREARVSRTTLYRHFPSVEAVLIELVVEQMNAVLIEAVETVGRQAGSFAEQLLALMVMLVKLRPADKFLTEVWARDDHSSVLRARAVVAAPERFLNLCAPLTAMLRVGVKSGALRRDLEPPAMSEWLLRNVWGLQLIAPPQPFPGIESVESYLRDFVVSALLSREERTSLGQLDLIQVSLERIERSLTGSPKNRASTRRRRSRS